MARYRILYWRHIPLGVKVIDVNGIMRENLPARFQDMFEEASAERRKTRTVDAYTTSGFGWGEEHERDGTSSEVAATIIQEIDESWDEQKALAQLDQRLKNMSAKSVR
ncbi:MAG: virulence factor [Chloroflexota bacterium]